MAEGRQSSRVKAKVLDDVARKRRIRNRLEMLEMDNHTVEPEVDEEGDGPFKSEKTRKKRGKGKKSEIYKQRYKNFAALLEEESVSFTPDKTNYITARVPPSKYPARHFCCVCGFKSNYTCVQCGSRFCCIKCQNIHKETRCLKYTA